MRHKKILITGNAGSGKTTVSKFLAKKLGINSYGLDAIVWKSGWVATPAEERQERIQKLIEKESWIIDGVSRQVFSAAEEVIFLDIPLYRCIFNILKRFLFNGLKTRDSLPENCPEYIGVFKAIKIAFIYEKLTRPIILDLIKSSPQKKITWIKNYAQLDSHKNEVATGDMNQVQVVHAIIRHNEKFLLGKRSTSKPHAGGFWASVGGRLEDGESLEAAIIRECREEIGVEVKPVKILRELVEREAAHIWFDVEIISGVPSLKNNEHSHLEWFTKSEAELLSPIVSDDLELIQSGY